MTPHRECKVFAPAMGEARAVRPFPFGRLRAWRHAEVALARQALRHLAPATPRGDALGPRFHALLGAPLAAHPRAPRVATAEDLFAAYEGTAIAAVARHATLGVAVALLDLPFARALAARALGVDVPGAAAPFTPADEGALMALASRAAALACAPSPPPVLRGVTDRLADARAALPSPDDLVVAWPWRLSLGDDAGELVLALPAAALARAPEPDARALDAVRDLRVALPLVAARRTLRADAVAALAAGDVLVLDALAWSGDAVTGDAGVSLGAALLPVTLTDARAFTIAGRATRPAREVSMAENPNEPAARTDVLAGLPVEVTVEIASTAATVGEVAAWRVGEVVALGQRVGDAVVVRAGGRAVARGELVDVEGEVGVRITELL